MGRPKGSKNKTDPVEEKKSNVEKPISMTDATVVVSYQLPGQTDWGTFRLTATNAKGMISASKLNGRLFKQAFFSAMVKVFGRKVKLT